MAIKEKITWLNKHRSILLILTVALVLRIAWINAVVVRDEADGGYIAMALIQGSPLYGTNAYSNATRPPLWYAIFYVSEQFFGNSIIPVRLLNDLLFLVSTLALFQLSKRYFGKQAALAASIFYAVFSNVPAFEGQLAIPASLATSLLVISLYFCVEFCTGGKAYLMVFSGFFLALSFLILQDQAIGVVVALVAIGASVGSISLAFKKKYIVGAVLHLFFGFIIPIIICLLFFSLIGETNGLIEVLLSPISSYNSGTSPPIPLGVIFLIIGEGLPLWVFAPFGAVVCALAPTRKCAFIITYFVLTFLRFMIPPNFPHHVLYIVPSASIISGLAFSSALESFASLSKSVKNPFTIIKDTTRRTWKSLPGIFVIVVLLMTCIPPVFLTAVQYPNTNINWEFIHWNNSFFQSYNEQQTLADFLKVNAKNKNIFIYDWLPEIYWLSGHRAPNRFVYSYKPPEINSTSFPNQEEYQEMREQVRNRSYEYIVFGSWWPADAIIQTIRSTYFYVTSIGGAYVYSKYDVRGERIYYSFIDNFDDSIKIQNGQDAQPQVRTLSISNDSRDAIFEHPPIAAPNATTERQIAYESLMIPENSSLRFGIAVDPAAWNRTGDGVLFEILVSREGSANSTSIFSSYIDPKHNLNDRKWVDNTVDLNVYHDQRITLYFVTNCGPSKDANYDWAYWGNPVILQGS